ncbi:hypothetical protein RAS12_23685 [Achromobacter seleniivolatilans]|uniref:GPI inositol-deacylase PGAP1-like alpha/beta domain-containing protein n=1 Tax=Achromobacter seleniivolatilans TaxID=3047478 RepID=A0ABY9LZ17_9BURK|nr:hypothetical protein [Achromobacter sp. R39]WMD19593.1 hypothetical protein RAS12_23685 [Achromobacter sp. R39]
MTDNASAAPRIAPMSYDARGLPVYSCTLTPAHIRDPVLCLVPPAGILPVVFVPGIMGSNLKSAGQPREQSEPVWRLDAGLGGHPLTLFRFWSGESAGTRQRVLHPERVTVDNDGAVPSRAAGTVMEPPGEPARQRKQALNDRYRERGWGEVSESSYHSFLLWLEDTLNSSYLPHQWPAFQLNSKHLEMPDNGAPHPCLKPGLDVPLAALGQQLLRELPHLKTDDLSARAEYRMPVHAVGYNWLGDNEDAAKKLAARIEEIRHQYGRNCQQVILVTHSMGGLVARRCAQLPGMSDLIAGVIHGVMPAAGAPVAYRRCKVGMQQESAMAGAVIGTTGKEVTAVFAQAPGALQLLPTKNYAAGWLRVQDQNDAPAMAARPVADPYDEIYLRRDRWWAMLREEWLAPVNGTPLSWDDYAENIGMAKRFHERINGAYHPNTYVYYGADPNQPSFESICWKMRRGQGHPDNPLGVSPDAIVVSSMTMADVRDSGSSPQYVGGKRIEQEVRTKGDWYVQTKEISHWELHCAMQDGSGDGTVPVSSGKAPAMQAREGQVQAQIKATGFDHEGSYGVALTRHITLYALIKIAAKAKRPL